MTAVFETRLSELPADYVAFVKGSFVTEKTIEIAVAFGLNKEQVVTLQENYVLFLLFIYDRQELVKYLGEDLGVSSENATLLADTFIDSLPDSFPRDEIVNKSTAVTPETLTQLRTMASDMQGHEAVDGTYRSSQDELLRREPTPQPNSSPRWDTDTSQ